MISRVTDEDLPSVWGLMSPMIERALSKGQGDGTTPQHAYQAVLEGYSQMWVVHEGDDIQACAIIGLEDAPNCKKLIIEVLAGRGMDEWGDTLTELLSDFKDILGAKCLEASCRPGLAKYLKTKGWKQKAIIMEKI